VACQAGSRSLALEALGAGGGESPLTASPSVQSVASDPGGVPPGTELALLRPDDLDAADVPASSVTAVIEEDAPAAGPAEPAARRLSMVPFRTQRDGSRFAGSNCGPAALAMVLETYGISEGNDDLRFLSHTYQGTAGRRGGTALQHLAHVAEDYGIATTGLYTAGEEFHRWTIAELRAEVEQGRPAIVLVKYRMLPGREYSNVRYDHYVVLWSLTADGFVYNDPIYPAADEGYARQMTDSQLEAAMRNTMEPRQAVAFVGPAL
jgi:hypothetical protein